MAETNSIKCKFCDSQFQELKRFESHLIANHKEINNLEKIEEFKKVKELNNPKIQDKSPIKKFRLSKKEFKKKTKTIKPKYVSITVISRRGTKVRLETVCSSCLKSYQIVWQYNKTNIGAAYLCYSCKIRILKTFNHIRILYSNPESNRKKF